MFVLSTLGIQHRNTEVKVLNWFVLFYLRRIVLFVGFQTKKKLFSSS